MNESLLYGLLIANLLLCYLIGLRVRAIRARCRVYARFCARAWRTSVLCCFDAMLRDSLIATGQEDEKKNIRNGHTTHRFPTHSKNGMKPESLDETIRSI